VLSARSLRLRSIQKAPTTTAIVAMIVEGLVEFVEQGLVDVYFLAAGRG